LISRPKGGTQIVSVSEQDAEENISTYEKGTNRRMEKTSQ